MESDNRVDLTLLSAFVVVDNVLLRRKTLCIMSVTMWIKVMHLIVFNVA